MWNEANNESESTRSENLEKSIPSYYYATRIKGVENEEKPDIEIAKETLRAARQSSKKLW